MPLILPRKQFESTLERTITKRKSGIPVPTKSGLCHASKPNTNTVLTTPAKKLQISTRQKSSPDPEVPYLELVPFGRQPTVNFGSVRVGQTKLKYVVIRNIEQMQKQVFVKSFPKKAKGFDIDATEFLLAPRTEILITLAWTPSAVGSIRETISLQDVSRMPSRIILVGESIRADARTIRATKRASPKKIEHRRVVESTRRPPLTRLPFPARRRQSSQLVARIKQHQDGPKAALIIQKNWRRVLAERELTYLRARSRAAVAIQKNWRRVLAERKLAYLRAQLQAARTIQRNWRMVLAKRKLAYLRTQSLSAMTIQRNWRRVLAERKLAYLRAQTRAAVTIQKNWRRSLAERKLAHLRIQSRAAVTIQKNWRRVLAERKLAYLQAQLLAARTIQKNWRMVLAQRKLAYLRTQSQAVVNIQKNWRRFLAKRELAYLRAKLLAAVTIQKNWRRVLAKRKLVYLRTQSRAAVTIQKNWRRVLAERELAYLRAHRQAIERLVIYIQPYCRGFLYRRQLARSIRALKRLQHYSY